MFEKYLRNNGFRHKGLGGLDAYFAVLLRNNYSIVLCAPLFDWL